MPLAASEEIQTGLAPPFRAPLGTAATAVPAQPEVHASSSPGDCGDLPAVPGYEIIAELGRGGMGVVYQARHGSLKRVVALKMILAGLHADATARVRFRTEAEAVARLQHPNIVQIHEVGEAEGRPFLSLEHIDGGNLLGKIAGTAQPEREAARLVEMLARAVHYTHQRGILHRDLKPTNIMLTADGTPKITDFGLAKLLDGDIGPTWSETFLGTPSYMAPEQATGDTQRVGARADVYSLGAVLYELLTGYPPFRGASPLSILEQVRTQEPVPPRRLRRSLSADLETICLTCLEKEPDKRYPSALALANDLHCFLEGQPIQARPVPVWQRLWKYTRRRSARVAWTMVAAVLVGLWLAAGSYFRAADQLAGHRAEEKYQQFIQRRDEALVYGLLAPEEGAVFLGAEAAVNLKTARSAAQQALQLAGLTTEPARAAVDRGFSTFRKAEIAADCYALLLVLAGIEAQQPRLAAARQDQYQEALRLLERARQLGFHTRAYHLRRAHLLEQLGQQREAMRARAQALSVPVEDALDHFLVGEEQYRRGDWPRAMRSFHRALSLRPGNFWAQFFLAVCHLKSQHWEAAKADLNACLTQQPGFVWAYLFRSFANEKLQALPEAEADFYRALQLNPNEDARYALFLMRGVLYFNQNDWERAATAFRCALALKPEQGHAYLNLAHVLLAQGKHEAATEQVTLALRFQAPIQAVAGYHVQRGRYLLQDERYEEALQVCAAALELYPQQAPPYEVRGHALLALGRYEQAERSFDHYLRQGGEATADIFKSRGLARMKLANYPEAVDDYTRALERAPDGDIYQHRGWAQYFSDAWKLALRDFSNAIALDPDAADAYTGRGLARMMLGDYREAIVDAEAALRRKPSAPEMMHNLACIFAQACAHGEADRQEADRYRRRALAAVHQTLALLRAEERSAFWRDKILPDAALAPIRDDAEFKRLQEEYSRR